MLLTLTHSPADVVRWLLVMAAQGTDPGQQSSWPVFATNEPSVPDNCITLYDTVGQDDGRSMHDGELFTHHGFQVRVRGTDHNTGWLKADALRKYLATGLYNQQVDVGGSSYLIQCCSRIGQVLALGVDNPQSKRKVFTLNALVTLTQQA